MIERALGNMYSLVPFAFGCVLLAATAVILGVDGKRREAVLNRLPIRRRRATTSLTPPRSLSPEKQGLPPNKPPSAPDYSDTFPPHRREALKDVHLGGDGQSAEELSKLPADYTRRVPNEDVCNTDSLSNHVTATGFTVDEISRLGDFPDYATLSGVPLPQAYEGFDITKAKPRPYRPIRWAYHQTMCKFNFDVSMAYVADQNRKPSPSWSQIGG